MSIKDDFVVDGKKIRHVSGSAVYQVIELHRFLQHQAEGLLLAGANPSIRYTDYMIELLNGYNIDEATGKFLTHGSIIQHVRGEKELFFSHMGWNFIVGENKKG